MRNFRENTRPVVLPMVVSIALVSMPLGSVKARMVSTEQVTSQAFAVGSNMNESARDRVMSFLMRQDVRNEMRKLGVNPDEAQARVKALSDSEIQSLAGRVDQLPAGGDAVAAIIGAAVLVFVVLLITDLLCFTKVFPFTKCIAK